MKDFAGRTAFVTGGANGIGIGLVRALLDEGCKVAIVARTQGPIDAACGCMVCRRYTRAYLRHLFVAGEALSATLNSIHNLAFYLDTMERVRADLAGAQEADPILEADPLRG